MHLTPGQRCVLSAMKEFGRPVDDVALAVYVHHVSDEPMTSSGVRSRRAELSRLGLVEVTGEKRAKSGRAVSIHGLTTTGRKAVGRRIKATA